MELLTEDGEISKGSYGIVYSTKNKNIVLKRNIVEEDKFGIVSIKEYDINRCLKGNENISKLLSVSYGDPFKGGFSPIKTNGFKDDGIHFIFERADMDLEKWIETDYYDIKKVYSLMLQISLGLEFIHRYGIIHRDLKLKNILIRGNQVKITDFGMSTFFTKRENDNYDIVTLEYRAPEIMLREEFNYTIDVWSLACVFLDLVNRKLFFYEESTKEIDDMLKVFNDRLPNLFTKEECKEIGLDKSDIENIHMEIDRETFERNIGHYDDFMDLLNKMLVYKNRITIDNVLNHRFFIKSRDTIHTYRRKYSIINNNHIVIKTNCSERYHIGVFIEEMLSFKNEDWFRYRIFFHVIDILDRLFIIGNVVDMKLYLNCAFYICLKYFNPECFIPDIRSIINCNVKQLIKKEEEIIDNIMAMGPFYRRTVFEESENIQDIDVEKLLIFYYSVEYNATPQQYLSDFLNN